MSGEGAKDLGRGAGPAHPSRVAGLETVDRLLESEGTRLPGRRRWGRARRARGGRGGCCTDGPAAPHNGKLLRTHGLLEGKFAIPALAEGK